MWRYLTLLLFVLLIACEPTELDEGITVSDTPYLVYVYIGNDADDSVLVPAGKAMAVNDVESVTLTYEISPFSEEVPEGFIRVEAINVLIDGSEDYAHLVQVTIVDEIDMKLLPILNETMTVEIIVELLEPIDEQEAIENGYDLSLVNVEDSTVACEAIVGKVITFDISFVLIEMS